MAAETAPPAIPAAPNAAEEVAKSCVISQIHASRFRLFGPVDLSGRRCHMMGTMCRGDRSVVRWRHDRIRKKKRRERNRRTGQGTGLAGGPALGGGQDPAAQGADAQAVPAQVGGDRSG